MNIISPISQNTGSDIVCTATNPITKLSVSSPPHRLSVSYDFTVFTDTAVVTATLDEDDDNDNNNDNVVLHCGAALPSDKRMAQHLLTHTLSWYKIPNALVRNSHGEDNSAAASSSGLKKDLQLQVPDFHNADEISFYVGREEAMERKKRRNRRMRRRRGGVAAGEAAGAAEVETKKMAEAPESAVLQHRRNKRHLGSLFPFSPFSFSSSSSASSSSATIANVFSRHLGHHGHGNGNGGGGGEITRNSLILSYSQYPTLDFEKLAVKKDANKFGLANDNASLTINGVEEEDFGIYVCQVDLHYIPIPPAPQNLHKAVAVELRRKIEA